MTARIFKLARKSMVVVVDTKDADAYSSGCVMIKDKVVTLVASSAFVKGREMRLKVVFFDRIELEATVVAVRDSFCLLRTAFHSECKAIRLLKEEGVVPQSTFMFAPQSRTTTRRIFTYATTETLESYLNIESDLAENSTNYFMVSCSYFGKTRFGINSLTASPVFTMWGRTAGIVLQDCRVAGPGAEMKVTLKARHVRELMMLVDPPAASTGPRKKRKRS
ncbi:unnamed protein product [Urochloa decumbens]|uniref:Pectinesterase n=1 Tax=Urochloa decumbens TaxID=240449 RepID=A0ABC9FHN2_9POAL